MPHSKPVGGFDLVLGDLYNDSWFNRATPDHNSPMRCDKCPAHVTIHRLEKVVLAFGKVIIKNCDVTTCPACLHEVLINSYTKSKAPATKRNLTKLFSKLPKSVQTALLTQGGK